MPFIWIESANAKPYTLIIGLESRVRALRTRIAHLEGLPADAGVLEHNGVRLQDDKCLSDYGIVENSRIRVCLLRAL